MLESILISEEEWNLAEEYFVAQNSKVKLSRKKYSHLKHSFLKIENELYAIANKAQEGKAAFIGWGGYSINKLAIRRSDREIVKIKIENTQLRNDNDPYIKVLKSFGAYYGQVIEYLKITKSFNKNEYFPQIKWVNYKSYTALQYIAGKDLLEFATEDFHTLTNVQFLVLLLQCCLNLQEYHCKNIIHGDVKPENIIVCSKEQQIAAKLIDLDLCIQLNENEKKRVSRPFGTIMYMAPEIKEKYQYSFASDIYALGRTFDLLSDHFFAQCDENTSNQLIVFRTLKTLFNQMLDNMPKKRPSLSMVMGRITKELTTAYSGLEQDQKEKVRNIIERVNAYQEDKIVCPNDVQLSKHSLFSFKLKQSRNPPLLKSASLNKAPHSLSANRFRTI